MDILKYINVCFCVACLRVRTSEASHTITSPYLGQGHVLLENAELRDTEGNLISCTLSGEPYATITWKWKDGQSPGPEDYFVWFTTEIATDPKLSASTLSFSTTVTEAQKREIKTRTIYALGSHTDDPSKTKQCDDVILSFIWKPEKPSLSISKDRLVFGEDSATQLTCQVTDKGNPEGQVRWIKSGSLQSEPEYNTQTISIPVTKNIDGDKWQCYYYNTAGDGEYSNEPIINVHWSPGGATISADTQTPKRDDTFTFMCTGDRGNPPGRVLWYLSGTMVENTTNKQYTVTDAKESHNGNWSCMFRNYINNGTQSQIIQIQVQYKPSKPELVLDVDSNDIRFGDNFTIQCLTQRGATTIWLKNDDEQYGPGFNNNNITVIHADSSVIGVWSCYVFNEVGQSNMSNAVEISVKYIPGVQIDYITYEFTSESVGFTLKIKDLFAAVNLEVAVCSLGDTPSCSREQQFIIEHRSTIEQNVVLPGSSDGEVYNVTFTFYDDYRIVTQHGMALKGSVVQGNIPTILAILFGTLLIVAIATILSLVYVFHWRNKATGTSVQKENSMHYVNVGSEGNSGEITQIQAIPEYEDVNAAATTNGDSSNIANTTYMDLDQNDIQQTRNRPAEVTVYQSLN